MKTVFTNSADILHLFAQQTQGHAKCSNVFFYGKKCYSYGYHYKLAEFIKDFILINDTGYSHTTSKHIAQVTGATRQYKQYFESNVLIEKVLPFVKSEYEKLLKAKKPIIYIQSILGKFEAFEAYPLNKKLKSTKYKELKNIANLVLKIASNVDNFKDTLKSLKQANEKKQKAILNKSIKNFEEYKINFIKSDEDYLRFSECGEYIETSQQIKVSKQDAKALYSLILAKKDIKGHNISGYIVTSLNGTLKIGCHKINIHSMNKIGKKLINTKKYNNMETKNTDLFNNYENLPTQVQNIINEMNSKELDYIDLKNYNIRMIIEGYYFDFDLSATPFNLRKIETLQDVINTDIYGLL
jgi:hypothetical protein